MFKKLKNSLLVVLLIAGVFALSGCFALFVGAAAGVGGYAWVKGSLEKEFQVSTDKLYKVTIKTLKQLDLPIRSEDQDRLSAKVTSEFSDGADVTIAIDAITEKSAKLKIRVGVFGDKTRSELILNKIQKNL